MTRITQKQEQTILKLFAGGSTLSNLADSYGVPVQRIEDIIRKSMEMFEEKT